MEITSNYIHVSSSSTAAFRIWFKEGGGGGGGMGGGESIVLVLQA